MYGGGRLGGGGEGGGGVEGLEGRGRGRQSRHTDK